MYRRLVTAVNDIEKRIPFSHDDRLGFLTFCPTNLGTTVRASVHIKVPKLAADRAKLEEVAGKYNLQVSVLFCLHCGQDYFITETGGHVSDCCHARGCSGITTVFCGTLVFQERLSGLTQVRFLYNKIGKYKIDIY